jgi:hypothetical protein
VLESERMRAAQVHARSAFWSSSMVNGILTAGTNRGRAGRGKVRRWHQRNIGQGRRMRESRFLKETNATWLLKTIHRIELCVNIQ